MRAAAGEVNYFRRILICLAQGILPDPDDHVDAPDGAVSDLSPRCATIGLAVFRGVKLDLPLLLRLCLAPGYHGFHDAAHCRQLLVRVVCHVNRRQRLCEPGPATCFLKHVDRMMLVAQAARRA